MHLNVLCSLLPSFAGWFQCCCCALEQGTVAVIPAMCHLVLDSVARSKNKRWKNMQTEETRHNFTSWSEQLPFCFLAPFFKTPWVLKDGYCCIFTTYCVFPHQLLILGSLQEIMLLDWYYRSFDEIPALLFFPSILELHISLLKKNRVIQAFRVIPSLTGEVDERVVYWCLFDLIFLKYKHLVSSWVFTIPVFVIQKSSVKRIKWRSSGE